MSLRGLKAYGGMIVGRCDMADVVTRSASPWFVGPLGFVLKTPVTFREPIPFKAALGLLDVPAEIAARVAELG